MIFIKGWEKQVVPDTMNFAQPSFDELNSSSLAALGGFPNSQPGCTGSIQDDEDLRGNFTLSAESGKSIDDFLANYRQETSSIQAFVCQLDDGNTTLGRDIESFDKALDWRFEMKSCSFLDSMPGVTCNAMDKSISFPRESPQTISPDLCLAQEPNPRLEQLSPDNKSRQRSRLRLSAEKRDERRRNQNREYQRRYREKRMRLEFQRLMPIAPAIGTSYFPPY
jgi:hypothetical protein